jgi:hypothetical protein
MTMSGAVFMFVRMSMSMVMGRVCACMLGVVPVVMRTALVSMPVVMSAALTAMLMFMMVLFMFVIMVSTALVFVVMIMAVIMCATPTAVRIFRAQCG